MIILILVLGRVNKKQSNYTWPVQYYCDALLFFYVEIETKLK